MNPARFLLGPPPLQSTLRPLGLQVTIDPALPAAQTCPEALGILAQWRDRCDQAIEAAVETGGPGAGKHERLSQEIQRAGERAWVGQVFNADALVGGVTDLVAWCRLQVVAISVARSALPVVFVSRDKETLLDRQFLGLMSAVPPGVGSLGAYAAEVGFVSLDDDPDAYFQEADVLHAEQRPSPRGLTPSEVYPIVRNAHASLSMIYDTPTVNRPPRPPGLQAIEEGTTALGALLQWCSQFDGKSLIDGPIEGNGFVLDGKAYYDFSPTDVKLLTILHERRQKLTNYSSVEVKHVVANFGPGPTPTPKSVEKYARRLSKRCLRNEFPATIHIQSGVILTTFGRKVTPASKSQVHDL